MSLPVAKQERLMQVLVAPHVSEKGTNVAEKNNQVIFRVQRDATKPEIKQAVESLFKVKVLNVRTLNQKGKNKRFGAFTGRRSDWKKAYITLAPGQEIDFAGGAAE
jgi:large subunit ribosomal protein L23